MKKALSTTYRTARRIVIAVVGGTVLLLGLIMLIGPGPGLLGTAAGLGILSIEFAWARRWLRKVKEKSKEAARMVQAKKKAKKKAAAGTTADEEQATPNE